MERFQLGVYREIIMFTQLISSVLLLGLPMAIYFFLGRVDVRALKISRFRMIQRILLVAAGASLPLLGALLYMRAPIVEVTIYTLNLQLVVLISVVVSMLVSVYDPCFVSLKESRFVVLSNLLMTLVSSLAIVMLWVKILGYEGFLIMISLAPMARLAWSEMKLRRIARLEGAGVYSIEAVSMVQGGSLGVVEVIKYAFPVGLSNLLGLINKYVDRMVVIAVASVETFASYSVAAFELPFVSIITGSLATTLIPEYANHHEKGDAKLTVEYWNRSGSVVACFMIPLAIGSIAYSRDIITILFSPKYLDIVLVFAIYQLILPVRSFSFGSVLYATGNSRLVLLNIAMTVLVNVAGNIVGYKAFGLPGLAGATVLSVWFMAAVQLMQIKRVLRTSFSCLVPWKSLAKITTLSLFSIGLPAILAGSLPGVSGLFIIGLPTGALTLYLLQRMRILPRRSIKR